MVDLARCQQAAGGAMSLVKIIQGWFRGFDQPMLSRFNKPEKYGARPSKELENLLRNSFPDAAFKARPHEKAGAACRVSIRPSNDLYKRLQKVKDAKTYTYMADVVLYLIERGLEAEHIEDDAAEWDISDENEIHA